MDKYEYEGKLIELLLYYSEIEAWIMVDTLSKMLVQELNPTTREV